nr:uncharacterized protein LOC124814623 [Hydra vulgaris]
MTSAIMGKLLSPKTSLLYSTYGKKGKKSFAALTSCQVVIAAVKRKYSDSNEKHIKVRIGRFLAQSSDREGGRKRRLEKSDFRIEENSSPTVEKCLLSAEKSFSN